MDRQAYLQKWQAKLDEMDARLSLLQAKAKNAQADGKIRLDEEIQKLERKQAASKARLEEINAAGKDSWRDLTASFESASSELGGALDRARERFKQLL